MKKKIAILFFGILLMAINAFSEEEKTTSTSTANSQSTFNYSITDNSSFKSLDSPNVSNLTPYTNVPNLYRNQVERKSNLELEQDNNTKFLERLMFKNKIKLKIVDAYAYYYFFNKAVSTGEIAIDRSDDELNFLPEIPFGDDVWPTATVRIEKEEGIQSFERVICTALKQGYDKSDKSKYFTIKYEISDYSQVGNKGIGVGATVTKDAGGSTTVSGGTSFGISKAKGNVFKGGYYEVTFWNRGKSALISANPAVTRVETKKAEGTKILNVPQAKEIFFDFDSSEIKHQDQINAINNNVDFIENNINRLQENQIFCFFGKASQPGTVGYNRNLGGERSKEVYKLTLRKLYAKGYPLDYLKKKIKFSSDGKEFPISENNKDSYNQEVIMAIVSF